MSNLFSQVKENLSILDVARRYGVQINEGGFINCPHHAEKTPSMKLYQKKDKHDNFHCFSCGAHGDIIDLVSIFFNLDSINATRKLARDFGIIERKPSIIKRIERADYEKQENRAYKLLADYCGFLKQCQSDYAPKNQGEELNPLFVKSLSELGKYNYYKDILTFGTKTQRQEFLKKHSKTLSSIEKELNQLYKIPKQKTAELDI